MFIWIYRVVFAPIALLASPFYILKMRRRGGYEEGFLTRFGIGLDLPSKRKNVLRIWIHAVSLGEMLAIEPMLMALARDPRNEIFLTTTTSTGFAEAKKRYSETLIGLAYFPLDFWPFSRIVWKKVMPDLAICAETEIWPEHLRQADRRGVPLILVNARLSDRSFRYAAKFARFTQKELACITEVLAGSRRDKDRFQALGVKENRILVTGNLKVDIDIQPILDSHAKTALKKELGLENGFILLGSGTWLAEERMLLKAFKRLRSDFPDSRLLIVPRHVERRDEIARFLSTDAEGLSIHFKKKGEPPKPVDILVADTNGELRILAQLADVAFIGKSLPPEDEGQTPIEACVLGIPTLFGPGMKNFPGIIDQLLRYRAAIQVSDEEEAITEILRLSRNPEVREEMSKAGLRWHKASRGAVEATLERIEPYLPRI